MNDSRRQRETHRARLRHEAELELQRVVEEYRATLVEVSVRTLHGRRRRGEMHQQRDVGK